ncbi:MAG: transglutaminase family protein, partial [Cyanobium sp.]
MEQRLQRAGVQLTIGGEPTFVPLQPEGAEWTVSADGPTKLAYAHALAQQLQQRAWPLSTLLHCPGKRYDGEVNPRWVLRLITGSAGQPLLNWSPLAAETPPSAAQVLQLLEALAADLNCPLQPLPLRDPLQPDRQVWAVPLSCEEGQWQTVAWPLAEPL